MASATASKSSSYPTQTGSQSNAKLQYRLKCGLAPALRLYDEFQVKEGLWRMPLSIGDVFDHHFYDRVAEKHPELAVAS
jgi:hypothetical protein